MCVPISAVSAITAVSAVNAVVVFLSQHVPFPDPFYPFYTHCVRCVCLSGTLLPSNLENVLHKLSKFSVWIAQLLDAYFRLSL